MSDPATAQAAAPPVAQPSDAAAHATTASDPVLISGNVASLSALADATNANATHLRKKNEQVYFCANGHKRGQCLIYFPIKRVSEKEWQAQRAAARSQRGIIRHDQQVLEHCKGPTGRVTGTLRSLIRSNKERQARGLMQGNEFYITLGEALTSYRLDGKNVSSKFPKVGTLRTLRPSQVITDDDGFPIDHELLETIEARAAIHAVELFEKFKLLTTSWNRIITYGGMHRGGQGPRNLCCMGLNGLLLRKCRTLMEEFPILARCTDNFKAILVIFWAGYQIYWTR